MCKHIANVQVHMHNHMLRPDPPHMIRMLKNIVPSFVLQFAFQAPCCRRWFDCSECHFELSDHRLTAAAELAMLCRTCEIPFRKDLAAMGIEDEVCPHCTAALNVPVRPNNRHDHPLASSSTTSAVMAPSQSTSASTDASSKSGEM